MDDKGYPAAEDFEALIDKRVPDRCKCSAQGVEFTGDCRIVCRICGVEVEYE